MLWEEVNPAIDEHLIQRGVACTCILSVAAVFLVTARQPDYHWRILILQCTVTYMYRHYIVSLSDLDCPLTGCPACNITTKQ